MQIRSAPAGISGIEFAWAGEDQGSEKRVTGPRNKQLTHLEMVGCDGYH